MAICLELDVIPKIDGARLKDILLQVVSLYLHIKDLEEVMHLYVVGF